MNRARPNSAAIGSAIGAFFGGVWGVGAAGLFGGPLALPLQVASALTSLTIMAGLFVRGTTGTYRFRAPIYLAAVAIEVVALNLAFRALVARHMDYATGPVTGFIIGLHFIGLWLATGARIFLFITAGCCLVCVTAMALFPFPLAAIVAELGMALVLWGATASMVRR